METPSDVLETAEAQLTRVAEEGAAQDADRPLHPDYPTPTPGELHLCTEYARWSDRLASSHRATRRAASEDVEVFDRLVDTIEDGRPVAVPEQHLRGSRWPEFVYVPTAGLLGVVEGFAVLAPLQAVLGTEGAASYAMAAVVGGAAPVLAHLAADRPRFTTSFVPNGEQRRQQRTTYLGYAGLGVVWLVAVLGRIAAGRFSATLGLSTFTVDSVGLYIVFQTIFVLLALAVALTYLRVRAEDESRGRAAYAEELRAQGDASRAYLESASEREDEERAELHGKGTRALVTYRGGLETAEEMPVEWALRWAHRTRAELASGVTARVLAGDHSGGDAPDPAQGPDADAAAPGNGPSARSTGPGGHGAADAGHDAGGQDEDPGDEGLRDADGPGDGNVPDGQDPEDEGPDLLHRLVG